MKSTVYTNLFLVSSLSTTTPALAALRGFLNNERTISSFSERAQEEQTVVLRNLEQQDHYEESGECGVVCSVVPYEKILSCRTVGGKVCGANQRKLITDAVAHPDFTTPHLLEEEEQQRQLLAGPQQCGVQCSVVRAPDGSLRIGTCTGSPCGSTTDAAAADTENSSEEDYTRRHLDSDSEEQCGVQCSVMRMPNGIMAISGCYGSPCGQAASKEDADFVTIDSFDTSADDSEDEDNNKRQVLEQADCGVQCQVIRTAGGGMRLGSCTGTPCGATTAEEADSSVGPFGDIRRSLLENEVSAEEGCGVQCQVIRTPSGGMMLGPCTGTPC